MLITNFFQGDPLFLKTRNRESRLRDDEGLRLGCLWKKVYVSYRELVCYFLTIFDLVAIFVDLLVLHLRGGEFIVLAIVRCRVSDLVESFFVDYGIKLAHTKIEMGYSFFYFIALLIYSTSLSIQSQMKKKIAWKLLYMDKWWFKDFSSSDLIKDWNFVNFMFFVCLDNLISIWKALGLLTLY